MTTQEIKAILTESLIRKTKRTHKCTWIELEPAQAQSFMDSLTFDKKFEDEGLISGLFHDKSGINYLVTLNKEDTLILKIEATPIKRLLFTLTPFARHKIRRNLNQQKKPAV